ncbi:14064_t:CDS:1 [Acaulospora colombiana]|uniref:14064_t:CDS:1 n=1 Tax=Acaulospora colombiana TaxID=27376 RepID=A0ACA9KI89_9GLOM|nr:14064_t:CDS:1 [Acaulospora colombiana]
MRLNACVHKMTPMMAFNQHAKQSSSIATQNFKSTIESSLKWFRKQDDFIIECRLLKTSQHGTIRRSYSSKAEESGDNRKQKESDNNCVNKLATPPKQNSLNPETIRTSKLLGQFYSSLTQRDLPNTWRAYEELIRESKIQYLTRNDFRHVIELITQNASERSENFRRLTIVIDDMKSRQFNIARYDFHAIISYFARSGHRIGRRDVIRALSMFYIMKNLAEVRPNITTYNVMFNIAVKASQFEIALRLIHDMTKQGLKPGVKIFTSLIHNLATKCEFAKLTRTLDLMSKFGISPDSHTWNTVIWAHMKSGDLKSAMSVYSKMISQVKKPKMIEQHAECLPTLPTYHTLLPANIAREEWESARRLYDDMKFFNVNPTTESYNVIFCKFASVLREHQNLMLGERERGTIKDLVDYIFEDMKKREQVIPAPITFNYLLYSYLQLGDFKKASEIFQVMKNNNWRINKVLFSDLQNSTFTAN